MARGSHSFHLAFTLFWANTLMMIYIKTLGIFKMLDEDAYALQSPITVVTTGYS